MHLTPEQQQQLDEFVERLNQPYSSTTEANTEFVEAAVAGVANDLFLDTRRVVWCQSPWQAVALPFLFELLWSLREHDDVALRLIDSLVDDLWQKTWCQLWSQATGKSATTDTESTREKWAQFKASLLFNQLRQNSLRLDVGFYDYAPVFRTKRPSETLFTVRINPAFFEEVSSLMHRLPRNRQVTWLRRLSMARGMDISETFLPLLDENLVHDLNAHLRRVWFHSENTEQPLDWERLLITYSTSIFRSSLESLRFDRVHVHAFLNEINPSLYDEAASRYLKFVVDLLGEPFAGVTFHGMLFASARATRIRYDEQGRLHCIDGPALQFADGFTYYCWHDVHVPVEVILHPEKVSVQDIEAESNVEVRRIKIERYGVEKFIEDSGAELVKGDDWGVLYRKQLLNDEPIVMLKVFNSTPEADGSRKAYYLRVPPTVRTPREALAWTFDLREDEYRPSIES